MLAMDIHGAHQSYRDNYLDLDPVDKDAYVLPLMDLSFDWNDNDVKMNLFMVAQWRKIADAIGAKVLAAPMKEFGQHFDSTVYQTHHLNAGAIMGTDSKTRALNRYLQCSDAHNVFVPGTSAFPQTLGYNPTGLVAALSYWSVRAIREVSLKSHGPLMQA